MAWRFFRSGERAKFQDLIRGMEKSLCLDLGAGSGEYAHALLRSGADCVICADFSQRLLSECADPRMEKVLCDVESLRTERKCDLALCLGILEFLDRPEEFVGRLKRFLKPKGKVIVLLPLSGFWSFFYALYYRLFKGIAIKPLHLKGIHGAFARSGFSLERKKSSGIFSGFAVYALKAGGGQAKKTAAPMKQPFK